MQTTLRRLGGATAAVTVTAALAACGGNGSDNQASNNGGAADECADASLTLAHVWPENDPQAQATAQFSETITEQTDGSVEIDIFPAGQSGGDTDILEGLSLGTTDIWVGGAGVYNAVDPLGQFFVTPFMFDGVEDMYASYNGELGNEIGERLDQETDTTVIDLWPRGPRHITSNKALNTPEDLQGLQIRVPENPMFIAGFEAMGANPTPMDFTEVFTALQQGTIDGQENPLALILSSGFPQVQSHLNLTGHIIEPLALAIADESWSGLCAEQQEGIRAAAQEVGDEFLQEIIDDEAQLVEDLESEGMTVVEPDTEAFRSATQQARDDVGAEFADLYELVEEE